MTHSVVFMFSGQGSHYYGMARELYNNRPVFKEAADHLDAFAMDIIGDSILKHLYDKEKCGSDPYCRTLYTHPAIFIVEYAMSQLLLSEGVYPDYVLGSSLGEFTSAAIAGIMDVKDSLEAVLIQAKTFEEQCRNGGMVAIFHHPDLFTTDPVLYENAELASINFDSHFVISGATDGLKKIQTYLTSKQIEFQPLPVSHAFHSSLIDPASVSYRQFLHKKTFSQSRVPFASSLKGKIVNDIEAEHFWDVARKPILVREAIRALEAEGPMFYIDLGPGGTLQNFVKRNLSEECRSEAFGIITPFHQELKNLKQVKSKVNGIGSRPERKRKMLVYVFPGQGSQHKGMGGDLFDEFPELTAKADEVLGYSIKDLCQGEQASQLAQTQYTQPALYVVNALTFLKKVKETGKKPDFIAGHSLGEYDALFAASAFDFETGLKLVQKRGALMSQATGGGMAAIIGLSTQRVEEILRQNDIQTVDIANYNAPSQTVIAGLKEEIIGLAPLFEKEGMYIPLNVSGAFHSRYMAPSQKEFEAFILQFTFSSLTIPVISNVYARPYKQGDVKKNLVEQITHSVKWSETIRYLMGNGEMEFEEVGPGNVLTKLVQTIRREAEPLVVLDEDLPIAQTEMEQQEVIKVAVFSNDAPEELDKNMLENSVVGVLPDIETTAGKVPSQQGQKETVSYSAAVITPSTLGNSDFKQDYNLKYAYLAGSMYRGISSAEMVVKLGKAGMMGFLGTGGVGVAEIEESIQYIQKELAAGEPYGVNLLHNPNDQSREDKKVDLFLKYGVKTIEASAYLTITPALVRFRSHGLKRNSDGTVSGDTRIIAKISRPEIAEAFLSPAPSRVVEKMVQENKLTLEQAELLKEIPLADDLCAEADSGGHTDGAVAYALMPSILRLRDDMMKKYDYRKKIRVGAAGGIGAPEAAAAAFILGADFILTGSINQCTVEARTSDAAKNMLQQMNVQDTDYAPAGDMFELGAKVQVLKRGVFFPARANKLYDLYRQFNSLEEIDQKTKTQLEEKYFKRSFDDIYRDMISSCSPEDKGRLERNPKHKLGLVLKWYFGNSTQIALTGAAGQEVDYQIQCGPALGAFNQWVKGTPLENWRNRRVDEIGTKLMQETAELLNARFMSFTC